MNDGKARVIDGLCHRNRLGIAIDRDQAPLLAKLREDQTRVSAAAKGAINIDTIRANIQAVNRLVQQYRSVFKIFHHFYKDKSCNRSDSAPEADCSASISSLTR